MIRIRNLTKKYGKNTVFDNFSLDIEKEKITCILGESGSGKTTLLNALAGLTEYGGSIDKIDFSYAFQKPNLFNNLTVYENLTLVNPDREKAKEVIKELYLTGKENSYPAHLSGGESQRVSLARSIVYDKPILLLDEPFSNLDIGLKYRALESIKKYHNRVNDTVIMVTHDIKEAVSIADRIVVLDKGKIIYDNNKIEKKTENEIFDLLLKKFDK